MNLEIQESPDRQTAVRLLITPSKERDAAILDKFHAQVAFVSPGGQSMILEVRR